VTASGQTKTTTYLVNKQNRLLNTEQTTSTQTIIEQYFYDNAGNMLGRLPEALIDVVSNATGSFGLTQLGQMACSILVYFVSWRRLPPFDLESISFLYCFFAFFRSSFFSLCTVKSRGMELTPSKKASVSTLSPYADLHNTWSKTRVMFSIL